MNTENSSLATAAPGGRVGMHWSAPEGRDFLVWLARCKDAVGYADDYCRVTGRWHPNNGASSARRLLEEIGVWNPAGGVYHSDGGLTDKRRRRSIYWMRTDVWRGIRRMIQAGREDLMGSKRSLARHRSKLAGFFKATAIHHDGTTPTTEGNGNEGEKPRQATTARQTNLI